GLEFEEAVIRQLQQEAQRLGDVATTTAKTPGQLPYCKVGDCVVDLGPESAAPGARIVVEAKERADCTLAEARKEIEKDRKNRGAQVGLFIFSRRTAPAGLEPLARFGQDVCVVWDVEDAASDLVLSAGLSVARALCVRRHHERTSQAVSFAEIDEAILRIQHSAGA